MPPPAQPSTLRQLAYRWSSSLRVRITTITLAMGAVALMIVGIFLSGQIRDGLFEDRLDDILVEAAARTQSAQDRFNNAAATSVQEVQQHATDTVSSLRQQAGGSAGVALVWIPVADTPQPLVDVSSDGQLLNLISPELREAIAQGTGQYWQSISIPVNADGTMVPQAQASEYAPGVAVVSDVMLPEVGRYALFLVYSLGAEAATMQLVMQVLVIGSVLLVGLLLGITWYLTRAVLTPVQDAAKTAQEIAAGDLDQRLQVTGHDELALLGRSFNAMADSTQEKIQQLASLSTMQQQFVSDVSHELRTPLTTIRMAAEMLHQARASFPDAQARSIELLTNQVDRFELMLADLLEISRHDAGAAELDSEEVDIRALAERVIELMMPLAVDRGTFLRATIPPARSLVDCEAARVERIMRNLIVNAIEHSEGQTIDVQLAVTPQVACIVVRDYGVGMTSFQAEHVFDRFWRGDPSRTRTLGGTGLGLAISLEDARLHGGNLEAWGSPGEGAAFRLTLPRRAGMELPDELPLPLAPQRPEPDLRRGPDPSGPDSVPGMEP